MIRFVQNLSFNAGMTYSIVSAPVSQAGLPADNLLNRDRYRTCRITPSSNAATITCTLAEEQTVGAVGLFGMNLSASATGKCQLFDASSNLMWDSGTVSLFPAGVGYNLPQYNRGYVWWADDNYLGVSAMEITLTDTATYFDMSRIAFGSVWSPDFNPEYDGLGWNWRNTADYYRTQGSTGRAVPRDPYRQARYLFKFLSEANRNTMASFLQYAGQSLILSLLPEEGGQVETDHQMLCQIAESQDLIPTSAGIWQLSLMLEEI